MDRVRDITRDIRLLSQLVLAPATCESNVDLSSSDFGISDLQTIRDLANSNHVILRAFRPLELSLRADRKYEEAEWVMAAIDQEHARIKHAVGFLQQICAAMEEGGCPVVVIKSLDHWPDLGSDLDLYTDAEADRVVEIMRAQFNATVEARSWGDRFANKWNFVIPGLPELVEVHVGRLGQMGEQTDVTRSLMLRSRMAQVGAHQFRVAAPEDRIVISTLQRMYRHFYIRLCDILDNAQLLDGQQVDFTCLRSLGSATGLWEGIATYLSIISDYVEEYRGSGVPLAPFVTRSAKFGADQVRFRRHFLRVSILPHSVALYASELASLWRKGEYRNSLRLSLLPCLATCAALEQKLSGSDKGIW